MQTGKTYRSSLSIVRGLGPARGGTGHFVASRLSGVAIALLLFPVIAVFAHLRGGDHQRLLEVMGNPLVATLLLLFVGASAYHMKLGMRVIIEDYVHEENRRIFVLGLNVLFCWAIGLLGAVAILKMALGR